MTWMVTGGAGYIGSHVVQAFLDEGIDVVVVDDLSSGHPEFVPAEVPFAKGTVLDEALLTATLREHGCIGVVHLAGFKYAGVSVQRPLHTYAENVSGTLALLRAMAEADVTNIVFSSSAAVYGTPDAGRVTEDTPTAPESPYGESKLVGEWLIRDQARATADGPPRCGTRRCATSTWSARRPDRPVRLQPAQPVPAGAGRARGRAHAHRVRHRLPDARRLVRARLHPRGGPGRRARGRRHARWPTAGPWSRCTTWAAAPGRRCWRSWRRWPPAPGSTSHPRSPRVVRVTRPGSWPPASWPHGTWAGG